MGIMLNYKFSLIQEVGVCYNVMTRDPGNRGDVEHLSIKLTKLRCPGSGTWVPEFGPSGKECNSHFCDRVGCDDCGHCFGGGSCDNIGGCGESC
jgi:hypothetical protein